MEWFVQKNVILQNICITILKGMLEKVSRKLKGTNEATLCWLCNLNLRKNKASESCYRYGKEKRAVLLASKMLFEKHNQHSFL